VLVFIESSLCKNGILQLTGCYYMATSKLRQVPGGALSGPRLEVCSLSQTLLFDPLQLSGTLIWSGTTARHGFTESFGRRAPPSAQSVICLTELPGFVSWRDTSTSRSVGAVRDCCYAQYESSAGATSGRMILNGITCPLMIDRQRPHGVPD
jgi:hypothetical protein